MNNNEENISIFRQKPKPYYPITIPLQGNLGDLCNNPGNYGCTQNNSNTCGNNTYPVLDCEFNKTSSVCCPKEKFPYAKTTRYCTYLRGQKCFGTVSGTCPAETFFVPDCNMCCPDSGITNNMNFSSIPFDPSSPNVVGDLWNKDYDKTITDGVYKISFGTGCLIASGPDSLSIYDLIDFGSCGATWEIKQLTQWYSGETTYPGDSINYEPGGYIVYNKVIGKYLSFKTNDYGSGINIKLTTEPSAVFINKNDDDDTYSIQNARNEVGSFFKLGNIGNPNKCLVVDNGIVKAGDCGIGHKFGLTKIDPTELVIVPKVLPDGNSFKGYNWNVGNNECGAGDGFVSSGISFEITKVPIIDYVQVANLSDGVYLIKNITDDLYLYSDTFNDGSNNYLNYLTVDKNGDKKHRWNINSAIDLQGNKGYTIKNEFTNDYISVTGNDYSNYFVGGLSHCDSCTKLTVGTSPEILYIYENSDSTFSIQNDLGVCLTSQLYPTSNTVGTAPVKKITTFMPYFSDKNSDNCGYTNTNLPTNFKFSITRLADAPSIKISNFSGTGGRCSFTWYNTLNSSERWSVITSKTSCDNAVAIAEQQSIFNEAPGAEGFWNPSIKNTQSTPIFTLSGKCLNDTGNGIVSVTNDCGSSKGLWSITVTSTGTYDIINKSTGRYLNVSGVNENLSTSILPVSLSIGVTYEHNDSGNPTLPTNYYMRITNSSSDREICGYDNGTNLASSISWCNTGSGNSSTINCTNYNTGYIDDVTNVPKGELYNQVNYECGIDPRTIFSVSNSVSPNPNYQFTISGHCEIFQGWGNKCFDSSGLANDSF